MKIKTSIKEIEIIRCDYSRDFFDYCERFKHTYLFDSLNSDDLVDIIEDKMDLCRQYKGLDKWYTNVFSAFYSYLPDELIENSKDLYILKK